MQQKIDKIHNIKRYKIYPQKRILFTFFGFFSLLIVEFFVISKVNSSNYVEYTFLSELKHGAHQHPLFFSLRDIQRNQILELLGGANISCFSVNVNVYSNWQALTKKIKKPEKFHAMSKISMFCNTKTIEDNVLIDLLPNLISKQMNNNLIVSRSKIQNIHIPNAQISNNDYLISFLASIIFVVFVVIAIPLRVIIK